MTVENPGETSGGDALTPPPSVNPTPGGHKEVAPLGTGATEADQSSTTAGPSVAATPGGHTDVAPVGTGAVEENQSSTTAGPSLDDNPDIADLGPGLTSGTDTVLPTVAATPVEDDQDSTSESRTGALPEVSATPDPLAYGPGGTSR